MIRLYRALEALIHGGKIVLTGTGIEHRGGKVTVTGTGVVREWVLVSEQYEWLRFMEEDQECYCPDIFPKGYPLVPCPNYPTKDFYATWNGLNLDVHWLPVFDFNDDGKVDLRDLCHFAVGYVKGKWTLADFAGFAELYNHPAIYAWRYRRA